MPPSIDGVRVLEFLISTGLLSFIARTVWNFTKDHKEKHDRLDKGQTLLFRGQILDIYNRGKTKGYLGEHEKELANEIFDEYSRRGENGYIKRTIEKINKEEL